MNKKIGNWFLVLLWAGLIFFLSHQPNLDSGLGGIWDHLFSKSAHFLEYAFLTFLLIRSFGQHQLSRKKILILSVALAIGYGLLDEYHQSFVAGRESSLSDLAADSLGALFLAVSSKFLLKK